MAQWRDVAWLITPTSTKENGVYTADLATSSQRQVFANKRGVTSKEFYEAAAIGLKPEFAIEVRACEYQDEGYLKYGTGYFKLSRTTGSRSGEFVVFTCVRLPNSKAL